MYSRTFLTALGPRRRRRHRDDLPARRPAGRSPARSRSARWSPWAPSWSRSTHRSPALTNARVDVMTAFVSFDRVFEVLDAPNPIDDRARRRSTLERPAGRVELDDVWFRYPAASEVSLPSLEADVDAPLGNEASSAGPAGHRPAWSSRARPSPWSGRPGAGKTTLTQLVPRLYDVDRGRRADRRPRRARPHPGQRCARPSAWSARTRTCSTTPSAPTCATPARTPPTPSSRRRAEPPASTT